MSDVHFNYTYNEHDGIHILQLREERITSVTAPSLKTEFLRIVAAGCKQILVDMSHVKTIDSSGLGALTFGKRQIEEVEGAFAICCLQDKVMSLFRIAKLEMVFEIYESEEEALKKFVV